jgi:hypothetical protein
MSTEQVCQIYIPGAAGLLPARAFYHTKLNGRYRAKLVGVHYADNTNQHDHRLIKIKSDCLRMPFGSFTDMILIGNKGEALAAPSGHFSLDLEVMGGGMDIELEPSTAYNGGANNSFYFAILTFEVEKME